MTKALGFLIGDISYCCACAKHFAEKSKFPRLFCTVNGLVEMDTKKKCICGKYPDDEECLKAADWIIELLEGKQNG